MARPVDPVREEARQLHLTRYISARPCPHGHVGERFTVSTGCCRCGDIARAERLGKPSQPRPVKVPKPIAEPIPSSPSSGRFNNPALARALTDYHLSAEARQRSRYLDQIVRGITASGKVPHVEE